MAVALEAINTNKELDAEGGLVCIGFSMKRIFARRRRWNSDTCLTNPRFYLGRTRIRLSEESCRQFMYSS